jgi:hypothetical protein
MTLTNAPIQNRPELSFQIEGGSSRGAEAILTPGEIAEVALRRPERMLILSMFFVVILFSLGAFAFRFLKFYQFVIVSGFTGTPDRERLGLDIGKPVAYCERQNRRTEERRFLILLKQGASIRRFPP